MNTRLFRLVIPFVLVVLMFACGPSPEQISTMTALAWTATPNPTATPTLTPSPTPIPYDLTVKVTDKDGNPITWAEVKLAEADQPKVADENGQVAWMSLPQDKTTASITAQGYVPKEESASLQRGPNNLTVILERDLHSLLPSEACATGETPLYIEDFQDSAAQGWPEIELRALGWKIESDPAVETNIVVAARKGAPWVFYNRETVSYDNVVWRLKYQYIGDAITHLNFRFVESSQLSARYMYVGGKYSQLQRINQSSTVSLANFDVIKAGVWHNLEMGYYNGTLSIWLDGKSLIEYQDPQPWTGGTINLEPYPQDESSIVYYDDISVCGLNAPFAPMPTPVP
jgi:hypothetical protein